MIVQGLIDYLGRMVNNNSKAVIFGGGTCSSFSYITSSSLSYSAGYITINSSSSNNQTSLSFAAIILGTDDTPVKSSDCYMNPYYPCRTGNINTGTKNKLVVTGTYTNTSKESKTFKEIALLFSGSSSSSPTLMLTRSVFDEPVVIPAGESKSFTITLDMNKLADSVAAS